MGREVGQACGVRRWRGRGLETGVEKVVVHLQRFGATTLQATRLLYYCPLLPGNRLVVCGPSQSTGVPGMVRDLYRFP